MPSTKTRLVLAASLLALLPAAVHAQAEEEFVLKNGRRFTADSVKPSGTQFTATVVTGGTAQKETFKASDVQEAFLREPADVADARNQIAMDKFLGAISALTRVEEDLRPYREVPGAWWHRARILRMDAMASKGDGKSAVKLADSSELEGLPESSASMLSDFKTIVAPADKPETKITALQALAKRSKDPWISARAWLEAGNTNAAHGKMDEAIKAWLRVSVFNPAEKDLAFRGTIYAARAMQQIGRPQDGIKVLKDYLQDHTSSPYAAVIQAEISKLEPKKADPNAAPAPEKTEVKPEEKPEEKAEEKAEEKTPENASK